MGGTIHKEKIPANYLALFVINKEQILKEPVSEIIKPTYLQGLDFIYDSDDTLPKFITAIVYQLDPDNSLEVIYSQRLKDALVNKDDNQVNEIVKADFFTSILETTYPFISEEFLPNTIVTLDKVKSESYHSIERETLIWQDLIQRAKQIKIKDNNLEDFQKVIISRVRSIDDKKSYIEHVLKDLSYDKKWNTVNYAKNIDELDQFLSERKIDINVFDLLDFYEMDNVEDFIVLLRNKKADYEKYRIDVSANQLDELLSEFDPESYEDLDYLVFLNKEGYKLPEFKAKLTDEFKNNFSDNNILPEVIRLLKYYDEPIKTQEVSDATLYTRFSTLTEKDALYFDLLSMRLSRTPHLSGYQTYFNNAVAKTDEDYVEKIAKRILQYINYGDLLLKHNDFKDVPLYVEVVKKITYGRSGFGVERLSIGKILSEFDEISDHLEIDKAKFLKKLSGWANSNLVQSNIETLSNDTFQVALTIDNSLTKKILELKRVYYDKLSKDEWSSIFSDFESDEFQILRTINYSNWSSDSFEALKQLLIEKSGKTSKNDVDNKQLFDEIINSMESAGHIFKNTFNDVRDGFINHNNIDVNGFKFFADWLFSYSNLKREGVVRTIFKTSFLEDNMVIDLLKLNSRKLKSTLDFAEDESQDFKNAVIDKSTNDERIKELAQSLSLIPKSSKKK